MNILLKPGHPVRIPSRNISGILEHVVSSAIDLKPSEPVCKNHRWVGMVNGEWFDLLDMIPDHETQEPINEGDTAIWLYRGRTCCSKVVGKDGDLVIMSNGNSHPIPSWCCSVLAVLPPYGFIDITEEG